MSKDEEICYTLLMSYSMLLDRELERKAEMELNMVSMNCWKKWH